MVVHVVATNRKARHDYDVLETVEAGLVLSGTEVKSLRSGQCSLQESFAMLREGEATLRGMHIAPYQQGSIHNVDPDRDRRLLLHRQEIVRLGSKLQEQGLTLVPLRLYFDRGLAKVELGLAKGRKSYDKRRKLREDDERRRTQEALERHRRGQSV
ncbi:MAG: SsrA-binding protein SmpB [Candidatus Bipolaricaulota bacterium]|nr:SsrA-binding protein SmpB [Candidatus Bipolaricaulota bacterium]